MDRNLLKFLALECETIFFDKYNYQTGKKTFLMYIIKVIIFRGYIKQHVIIFIK